MACRFLTFWLICACASVGCGQFDRRQVPWLAESGAESSASGATPRVASALAPQNASPTAQQESSRRSTEALPTESSLPADSWVGRTLQETQAALAPTQEPEPTVEQPSTEIRLVGYQETIEAASGEPLLVQGQSLELENVIVSIVDAYPPIAQAVQQRRLAMGQRIGAAGAFDTKLSAGAMEEPIGFYENFRHEVGLYQPLFGGGQVFGGYRVGRGVFEPWYQERLTDESGEFKAGFMLPLLQDNDIDRRRADLWQARIEVLAAEPFIQQEVIASVRAGAIAYWDWVAAGNNARIATRLLELAESRREGIQKLVDEGELASITLVDNQRSIASRRAKLFDAQRKLTQTAIKLSLFFRDGAGRPIIVSDEELPPEFPDTVVNWAAEPEAVSQAVSQRPEVQSLEFERRQLNIELAQAVNLFQPNLDVSMVASQDVGSIASSKGDKDELEMELGLLYSLPLQRRKAIGKQRELQAKLAQNSIKLQFTQDKITTEVQSALVALETALLVIQQARESAELAIQMEEAERQLFLAGDIKSDLLTVNLREQASADAQAELVNALLSFFQAQADYQAALGNVR